MTRLDPRDGTDAGKLGWPVWRLALLLAFGAFASGLDASLANIGLNTISADLNADLGQVQWVATGYLLALAVSLPLCGWLGLKVGAGRLWLYALAAFTVTSALCAAAPSIELLIAARVAQGLAGGLLIPTGQAIIGQLVGPGRLGRVMSTLGVVVTVAPALGPVLGGLLLNSLSWPWLFLVNVPIGVIGVVAGRRYIPLGEPGQAAPLDWLGFVCIGAGLPLLVYGLTHWGEHATPSVPVLITLALGIAGLVAFGVRNRRGTHPLMDLGLYRNPIYAAASATAAFTGAMIFGAGLIFALYFQLLHHDSVIDTGMQLLSFGAGTAVVLPFAGILTDRYGGGIVAVAGNGLIVATVVPFALLGADTSPVLIQVLLVLLGMSIALAAVPPGIAAFKTVTADQLPDATTQVTILQRVGGALGAALFAVVLARGLPNGTEQAFHITFWWIVASAAIALGCSLWLTSAIRSDGPRGLS